MRACRCSLRDFGTGPPLMRTPASMFLSKAWPVRLALVMNARAPSTTATFAWTLPPMNGSAWSFPREEFRRRNTRTHCGSRIVAFRVPPWPVEASSRILQANTTSRSVVQRGNDAGDVVGNEAHEKEVLRRTRDDVQQYLLRPARRNKAGRWAGPHQFHTQLAFDAQPGCGRAHEHAGNLVPARLHPPPRGEDTRDRGARSGRFGEGVRVRSRAGTREPPQSRGDSADLRWRDEIYKVKDRFEERLHQIPAKKAESLICSVGMTSARSR